MNTASLFADPNLLQLERVSSEPDRITLTVKTAPRSAPCPRCHSPSTHLHSRYIRRLADLPWLGIAVRLEVQARRLYCRHPDCSQRIFCERIPAFIAPYARRTLRLNEALRRIGLVAGGEAGARLASALGMSVSPDTLIQRIRQTQLPIPPAPRVIGVDDWAKHKGQSYGTILVDHERRATIDLLPDREASSLADWLKQHPGVELISRDRAGAYADGARQGAPSAIQIADRWHLNKNMTEAVERFLNTKHSYLRQAVSRVNDSAVPNREIAGAITNNHRPSKAELWNERKRVRYEQVMQLYRRGASIQAIAREFRMHRRTVRMMLRAETCPQRATPPKRKSQIDRHIEYLAQRWAEGCCNSAQLHREIRAQGYRGSQSSVRHFVAQWRAELPEGLRRTRNGEGSLTPNAGAKKVVASARRAAWLLVREEEKLEAEEKAFVESLVELSPEIAEAQSLAKEFNRILKQRDQKAFTSWMERTTQSGIPEMKKFALGLERDRAAVVAALKYEWSNGPTEGHINRLKTLKRAMYGRAKFDLLRIKVLAGSKSGAGLRQ
ncbi:MAG: ISL3 family transposase [Acidobacteria bacterium]|nr:ISL3 family transposase [Acidobacteriota bacterium]